MLHGVERRMIRMCVVRLVNRVSTDILRVRVGVVKIGDMIMQSPLRWYTMSCVETSTSKCVRFYGTGNNWEKEEGSTNEIVGAVRKEGSGTIWQTTTFRPNFYDFYTHHLPKNSPNVSKWPSGLVSKEGSRFTTSRKPPLGVKLSVFSLVNIELRQEPGPFFNKISKNNKLVVSRKSTFTCRLPSPLSAHIECETLPINNRL